jgi:hypothetical protein
MHASNRLRPPLPPRQSVVGGPAGRRATEIEASADAEAGVTSYHGHSHGGGAYASGAYMKFTCHARRHAVRNRMHRVAEGMCGGDEGQGRSGGYSGDEEASYTDGRAGQTWFGLVLVLIMFNMQ